MNYRFQKLTSVYSEHLSRFLRQTPGYAKLSFQDLYDKYVNTHFAWSNYFATHLEALGNVAQDMFISFEPLQKAWATEHGIKYSRSGWLKEIVFAQVADFQPDVLFLEDLYLFDYDFRRELRNICRRPVTLIGWRAAPTDDYTIFKDLDLLLTCVPNFAELMRRNGARAEVLLHGFESSVLAAVPPPRERDLDFTFIGSLMLHDGFHHQRYSIIEELLQSTPLEVWSQISQPPSLSRKSRLFNGLNYRAGRVLELVGAPGALKDDLNLLSEKMAPLPAIKIKHPGRFHDPVYGTENFKVLARSKLTFNNHIDCAEDYAGNIRLFEATGMGACLVTDWKSNLPELFEPDSEVVTYRNADECVEKVSYLLDHRDECNRIAVAGQQRTLRDHTLAQRVAQLDETIKKLLASQAA